MGRKGERSTSYFLRLEDYRQNHNKIDRLIKAYGHVIETDEAILE